MARLVLPVLAALALVITAQATPAVRAGAISGTPTALRAFLLRADEPISHVFPRTPAFTWRAAGQPGGHYQFEISTSQSFQDGTLVFKDVNVAQPAETVPRQLPWLTGEPYALWAHVRWISGNGLSATQWSKPFGFNLQWDATGVPAQLASPEGLVRWTPINGATAYEVLYPDLKPAESFQTTTNVADEREFFTLHSSQGYGTIHWRVRAIRDIGQFQSSSNGLPAVSYGPWSRVFSTVNAPQKNGTLRPTDTVSDAWDKLGKPGSAHLFTPGFAWSPSAPVISDGIDPGSSLYRVYVFSDKNCVNRIFTGSIVGSPAWAPRSVQNPNPGVPALPAGVDATGAIVSPNETAGAVVSANKAGKASSSKTTSAQTSATPAATAATQVTPTPGTAAGIDLWDSGWPTGRFYWTVVPVTIESGTSGSSTGSSAGATSGAAASTGSPATAPSTGTTTTTPSTGSSTTTTPATGTTTTTAASAGTTTTTPSTGSATTTTPSAGSTTTTTPSTGSSATAPSTTGTAGSPSPSASGGIYQDTAVPQDACQAGDVMSFGKVSQPIVTSAGKPFLSGVGPTGREVTAAGPKASVFATPIAAWQPVVGATKYQIEMSRSLYPWRPLKTVGTPATSVVLPVTRFDTGVWYYHVRGIDENLPAGARAMAWSTPIEVRVTGSRIAVIK